MKKTLLALFVLAASSVFVSSCTTSFDEAEEDATIQQSAPNSGTDGGGPSGPDDENS